MSSTELADLAARVLPVLGFLVAITVVAEASDLAGVFDVAAHWAARAGRQRVWALWLLVVGLACVCTIVLSLDTTAVLLTPVAVTVARQVGLPPLPFAMTTLWLANTASLLLPVSNLTNLLALHRLGALGVGQAGYLRLAWAPALAAIAATVVLLALRHRRALSGTYTPPAAPEPRDRVLLVVAGACCLALGPAFVAGLTPWVPSSIAALVLVVTLLVRDRSLLRRISVPWQMVIGVSVLFVVVQLALDHGLQALLASLVGTGGGAGALFRVGAVGALAANVVNNLPAYLALESVTSDAAPRLLALLVGVDVGPLVTVWASLATLLWRQRCRSAGLEVSTAYLAREGLLCAVVAGAASVAALVLLT
ncbi:SLC13 family permease [Dermatophilaceae bacterium Soc4.6]